MLASLNQSCLATIIPPSQDPIFIPRKNAISHVLMAHVYVKIYESVSF